MIGAFDTKVELLKYLLKRNKIILLCCTVFAFGTFLLMRNFHKTSLTEGVSYSKAFFASKGELLRLSLSSDEKYRLPTKLKNVDPKLIEAFLLHEDQFFYIHPGFNPYSLFRGAVSSFLNGRKMGGSTITMQLARLQDRLYTKSVLGKIKQIGLAIKIELFYSKREILEAYLSLAPFGGNIEGIEAAALIYYGKSAHHLSLSESLTLAIIPQSPKLRSLNQLDPMQTTLLRSRNELLQTWLSHHPEDSSKSLDMSLPLVSQKIHDLPFLAPHFVNTLAEKYPNQQILNSNLNLSLQKVLEKKVSNYIQSISRKGVHNAAAMVLNIDTMEIESMIGSANFFNSEIQGQVNGTTAKRSPGSALKPFLYALALDQGIIHPLSLLKDTPMTFGNYDPENFDQSFRGPLAAEEALVSSRNIPAVYLDSKIKDPSFFDFLKNFGIKGLKPAKYYGLSLSLGGAEVTMEELMDLYAMLAKQGAKHQMRWLKEDLEKSELALISKEAAFVTLDMLTKNPRPEGQLLDAYLRKQFDVAWKTGTSFGYHDAWSVGVVGSYVVAVWLGNFNSEPNPAFVGREIAGPLFFQIVDVLKQTHNTNPTWRNSYGLDIKKIKVCSVSGHLPGPHCHHQRDTWFIPGKSPITTCEIHREVLISNQTGQRLCKTPQNPKLAHAEIFEFWPTDLVSTFKRFGITKKEVPKFESTCSLTEIQGKGSAPQITSPRAGVNYKIRIGFKDKNEIPLLAILDGDANKVTWFINDELIGISESKKPILWEARPGIYKVRAVDNLGRTDSRELSVQVTQ